jgi:uncharacterized membrane protein
MLPDSVLLSSLFGLGISLLITALGYSFIRSNSGFGRFVASKSLLILTIITVLYIAWWWFYGVMRHLNFQTLIGDEGTFMNVFWNTLHGRPFATELWYGNFFSTHFEPSLIFIALLWAPWQSQIWLVGLQTMICAAGAFSAYGIVRSLDLSPQMGLAFGLIWLFNISMRGIISVDFHGIIMVAALIIWIPLLLLNKRYVWAMLLAFILMNFKEDATVYLGGLGVIMALSYGEKKWGWILAGFAAIYYLTVHGILWPAISPTHLDYFALRFPNLIQPDRPPWLAILSDPLQLIYPALEWDRLWGLIAIFAPVLFLPFMRAGWFGLLPALWILFTMALYSIYIFSGYYAGVIFSLILIATIPGFVKLRATHPGRIRLVSWAMLGFLVGSWFFVQPDEGFSYFMQANLRSHPHSDLVQRMAETTPPNISVSSDKFIGSYFANRDTLRYFPDPENRLSKRIYLTDCSLCYPLTILAIGSLGYQLLEMNPCFLFLTDSGGSDAGNEFMSRLRWTEAEAASTTLWSTEPDRRASVGKAVHIMPGCAYGDVIVNTNKVFLPPGDYTYSVRVKKDERCEMDAKLPIMIRFIKPDGFERSLVETTVTVNTATAGPGNYVNVVVPFTITELGLTYLRINFGYKKDFWWDGLALGGLDMSFGEYYKSVFPMEATPGSGQTAGTITRLEEPKFKDSLVEIGNLDREQIVFGWTPGVTLPAGDYWVYYAADAIEDGEMFLEWAELEQVSEHGLEETRKKVLPMIFDRRGDNRDIQLNHSLAPIALTPGDRLEICAHAGLPATIRLKGIWLMNPVVTDYLLYLR